MCSFSGATGTSRVRHNARYVPYAQIRFDLSTRSTSESRQPHPRLQPVHNSSSQRDELVMFKLTGLNYFRHFPSSLPFLLF